VEHGEEEVGEEETGEEETGEEDDEEDDKEKVGDNGEDNRKFLFFIKFMLF